MNKKAIISVLGKKNEADLYVKGWHVTNRNADVFWSAKRDEAQRFNSKSEARRMGFQLIKDPFVVEVVTD